MRYVPSHCLRENMILAKNIYSYEGRVLLAANISLTKEYIERIEKMGINGVYIEDDISKNIKIQNIISEEIRGEAVKSIRELYNAPNDLKEGLNKIERIAVQILNEILSNKNIMVNIVDIKTFDDYLFTHSVHVAVLSLVIGITLKLENKKLEKLAVAGLLHDIGKIFISKEILSKENNLSDKELDIMKTHPELGYKYIKSHYSIPPTAYVGILQHHERYDGKGYPDNRRGEAISLYGRIICICNIYDNLISKKSHRKPYLPSEAIEFIMAHSGQIFDPKLVKVFIRKIAPYPLGSILKLSNGEIGIVIENYEEFSMRPKVEILDTGEVYDLAYDSKFWNITIVGVENR